MCENVLKYYKKKLFLERIMSSFKYILFDLDGTLTDPALGITNSVKYALEKFGITVEDRKELYKFIGPPLISSFMEYYDFEHKKAEKAL